MKSNKVNLSSKTKEIFFFDRFYSNGWGWYKSFYKKNNKNLETLEFSPSYFSHHVCVERIYDWNPNAKIIITLRKPELRLFSDFLHHVRHGYIDINQPILESIEKSESLKLQACYSSSVKRWIGKFTNENVLVLFFEDFEKDPQSYLNDICDFIDIERIEVGQNHKSGSNVAAVSRSKIVSRLSTDISFLLKKAGLSSLIEFLKKAGLKKVLYKKSDLSFDSLSKAEREAIRLYLGSEIGIYEDRRY